MVTQGKYSDYRILGVFERIEDAMKVVEKACVSADGFPMIEVWDGTTALHHEVEERIVYTAYVHEGGAIDIYEQLQRIAPMRARAVTTHLTIRAIGTDREEVLQKINEAFEFELGTTGDDSTRK